MANTCMLSNEGMVSVGSYQGVSRLTGEYAYVPMMGGASANVDITAEDVSHALQALTYARYIENEGDGLSALMFSVGVNNTLYNVGLPEEEIRSAARTFDMANMKMNQAMCSCDDTFKDEVGALLPPNYKPVLNAYKHKPCPPRP